MIIVKLMGGLGNQMFQYAAARSFAKNKFVYLDLSFLNKKDNTDKNFTKRDFELPIFNQLKGKKINQFFLRLICSKNKKITFLRNLFPNFLKDLTYVSDENFPKIKELGKSYILNGYFQNPEYFNKIRNELLEEFTFSEIPANLLDIENLIKSLENPVSLHVRRGDYLLPQNQSIHGTLPIEYYQSACECINKKVENPSYLIFSDDHEWCENNLTFIKNKKIISGQYQPWIDMYLMSISKHHIIANSSFSWWGAWLCKHEKQIVIAPKNWFSNNKTTDILPKNWVSI
ncbi:alpha-1,2-fucosyltransferase [Pedobacter nototheniae]|uniref:alpha-1,2-fucosyltransferase n=1 Tax=Pedobacter nototheniae TaxID=2488994 RepID=UPI00103AF08B|nr:alpha-1,2-fucosyltransferase [Pedobacter nototheniae]